MKYSTYINNQLILSSNSITESIKKITDHVPNEIDGWNNFFKDNHGHIVNNEEATVAYSTIIYDNGK